MFEVSNMEHWQFKVYVTTMANTLCQVLFTSATGCILAADSLHMHGDK